MGCGGAIPPLFTLVVVVATLGLSGWEAIRLA